MYRRDIWWPNDEIPLIFPVYASLALSRLVFLKLKNTTPKITDNHRFLKLGQPNV